MRNEYLNYLAKARENLRIAEYSLAQIVSFDTMIAKSGHNNSH